MRFRPRLAPPVVCLLFAAISSVHTQVAAPDYSKEPLVVEHSLARVVVDAEGTQTRDVEVRIRVQSAGGLQAVGTIAIPYSRELSTLDVKYVRSRKPDGTTVDTPVSAALEVAADLTQQAPTFSDVYLREFNVKGLGVGDTLEYALQIRTRSLTPPQFSIDEQWIDNAIVLGQDLEIAIPASVSARVKTLAGAEPAVDVSQGLRTYRWHRANVTRLSEKDAAVRNYERQTRPADVRVTSFASWADVGAAVRELWKDRAAVTPAIRDKAVELTRGLTTDGDKIAALYTFVSTKIRYVAVSFGLGRIQPHPASEVLDNGFGDCKDKHTLLTALLAAVGVTAEPALITPGVPLDPEVPTLSQFNHVISSVMVGKTQMWFDTTLEVAPAGLLVGPERDHDVLLVDSRGPARVVRTPAAPVRTSSWRVESVATLSATGTLDASVRDVISGDQEVVVRALLRSIPQAQWPAAAKELPLPSRFGGTVTDLMISPLEDTTTPLQITYHYVVDAYSDWSKGQVSGVVPFVRFPDAPAADAPPIPLDLAGPAEFVLMSRLTLPEGFAASLATDDKSDLVLDEAFARYQIKNTLNGRVFETHRELLWRKREVAPAEFETYRRFVGGFTGADYVVNLAPLAWAWSDRSTIDWYGGEDDATVKILEDAAGAGTQGNHQQAERMLQDFTRAHPASDKAWQMLAWAEYQAGRRDEGVATLKRRITTSPTVDAYKLLASWLEGTDEADAWRDAWKKFGKDDGRLALYLSEALIATRQYPEAVAVLESQAEPQARSSRFHFDLGEARLGDGQTDAGIAALRRAAELDASPRILNNVSYQLAQRGLAKDEALALAIRAVNATEDQTRPLTPASADAAALGVMVSLGHYWDTLAWAHFQLGHLEEAERAELASFDLMLDEDTSTHLAEIYKARGKPAGVPPPMTLRLPRRPDAAGTAEVYVLGGPDGTISDAAFIAGDASLKAEIAALRGQTLPSRFPGGSAARLLRRGSLTCQHDASQCELVLATATRAAAMK